MIDNIEDVNLKNKYLKEILTQQHHYQPQAQTPKSQFQNMSEFSGPFTMQDVYKRMNATPTPITLNSLQHQINQLKTEIQVLKTQYNNLQPTSSDKTSTSNVANTDNEIEQFLGKITEYKFKNGIQRFFSSSHNFLPLSLLF